MLPKWHALINFVFVYILYWFTSLTIIQAATIFLAAVLIDVDHYLYYILVKKKFSIKSPYNWFKLKRQRLIQLSKEERKKHKHVILIFHGIEPIIILFLLANYFPILAYISFGFAIHIIQDLVIEPPGMIHYKISVLYSTYDHILKRKLKHIL